MLPFSRASWIMDLVVIGMILVVPALLASVYMVKHRRLYEHHRKIQTALGVILLIVLTIFEIHVRLDGWRDRTTTSPYLDTWLNPVLYVHIAIATSTALLWIVVITKALRHFPRPAVPNAHSVSHKRWAKASVGGMLATAVTGWLFYWMAFVAG